MKLTDYIKGNRHGRAANHIEREAMCDPLLQDALDGYDAVAGDHAEALRRLQEKFPPLSQVRRRRRRQNVYRIGIAASLAVLIAAGGWLLLRVNEEDESPLVAQDVPVATPVAEAEIIAVPEPETTAPMPTSNIQIVDDDTQLETAMVFADFEEAAQFTEPASDMIPVEEEIEHAGNAAESIVLSEVISTADDLSTRPKESFTGSISRVGRRERARETVQSYNTTTGSTWSVDSHESARETKLSYNTTAKAADTTWSVDSLRAVREFDDYIAKSNNEIEGRMILEFTADSDGHPTRIRIVESYTADRATHRNAIRLLRQSPVVWPRGRMIRVAIGR